MLQPGDRLDHYIVDAYVGGGGMAHVYRVRHAILDTTMALKVLAPELVENERVRKRFLSEGRIMARVRHPSIVMVTDAVVHAGRGVAGLVMEYVEGPDLARVVARMKGPPDLHFVRDVLLPVMEGVHHVHREGVVHRDLKPANVLLSRDAGGHWHPRVTDFGVAWVADNGPLASSRGTRHDGTSRPGNTRVGALVGTPAYMAPEQASRRGRPTPRWDVWALGVILYELASGGIHPFARKGDEATLAAVQKGRFAPLTAVHPHVDPTIAAAVEAALRFDPAERVQSVADLAELLAGRAAVPPTVGSAPLLAAEGPPPRSFDTGTDVHDAPRAYLEQARGPDGPARIEVAAGARLGSGEDVEVRFDMPGVELVHCEIIHQGGRWILEDRSATGTRVNGARMDRVQLADGDLLRLGTAVLTFHLEEDAPATPQLGPFLAWKDSAGRHQVPLGLAPVVIGRSPACDLVVADPTVSLRHARVTVQGTDVLIEDLHSANGTWINGQRARFRRVLPGDVIRLGDVKVQLVV